jgi:hypothetical protein
MDAREAIEKGIWCLEPIVPLRVTAAPMITLPIALQCVSAKSTSKGARLTDLHGNSGLAPTESQGYDTSRLLHGPNVGTVRQPEP